MSDATLLRTIHDELKSLSSSFHKFEISATAHQATTTEKFRKSGLENTTLFDMANTAKTDIADLKANDKGQEGQQIGSDKIWKVACTVGFLTLACLQYKSSLTIAPQQPTVRSEVSVNGK